MDNDENLKKLHRIILDVNYLVIYVDAYHGGQAHMYELQKRVSHYQWHPQHDT